MRWKWVGLGLILLALALVGAAFLPVPLRGLAEASGGEAYWSELLREVEGQLKKQPEERELLFTYAVATANLGRLDDSVRAFRQLENLTRLPDGGGDPLSAEVYEAQLAAHPGDLLLLNKLAFLYYAREEYGAASRFFRQASQLDSSNEWPRNYLAYCLYRTGDLDGALSALEEALALNPHNSYTHLLLGLAYAEKGWYLKSLQELAKGRRALSHLLSFQ
ncbi:MAG: tetratricopeptide repeat protein [Bacillota bacterium]|nr:tetratricopeptide repeat protein [Bacillota bacterium]